MKDIEQNGMICLTRFNNSKYYLNAELIQSLESTPDTVITLTNGQKIVVKDSLADVISQFIHYKRLVNNPELTLDIGEK